MMIELQNVIKSYKSSNSRKVINVVDDISLSMEAGKSYGLVGHNGAGIISDISIIQCPCILR